MSYSAPPVRRRRNSVTTWALEDACLNSGPLVYATPASATWPTQYLAIYVPIRIKWPGTVRSLAVVNGATASGNFDIGLYNAAGTRLVSSGSTAQSGTTTEQVVDVTDTYVAAGLHYIALAMDGTSGTTFRYAPTAPFALAIGVLSETLGSVVLPATATWTANQTLAYYPLLAAQFGTTIT